MLRDRLAAAIIVVRGTLIGYKTALCSTKSCLQAMVPADLAYLLVGGSCDDADCRSLAKPCLAEQRRIRRGPRDKEIRAIRSKHGCPRG